MVFRILCACALYGMFAGAQAQMTERSVPRRYQRSSL